eukprot:398639-Rhodomonas_salina.2
MSGLWVEVCRRLSIGSVEGFRGSGVQGFRGSGVEGRARIAFACSLSASSARSDRFTVQLWDSGSSVAA